MEKRFTVSVAKKRDHHTRKKKKRKKDKGRTTATLKIKETRKSTKNAREKRIVTWGSRELLTTKGRGELYKDSILSKGAVPGLIGGKDIELRRWPRQKSTVRTKKTCSVKIRLVSGGIIV